MYSILSWDINFDIIQVITQYYLYYYVQEVPVETKFFKQSWINMYKTKVVIILYIVLISGF